MRHQIGRQLANGGAIHHQPEMLWPQMIPALFQTFGHGAGKANGMAAEAFLNGQAGFVGELIHGAAPGETASENAKFTPAVPALGKGYVFR
jgi:hypothetical protein